MMAGRLWVGCQNRDLTHFGMYKGPRFMKMEGCWEGIFAHEPMH